MPTGCQPRSGSRCTLDSTMTERIVVLGGGFAGVSTAQELARRLRKERRLAGPGAEPTRTDRAVSVTLIDRDNYFVFQPLLADIISGAIETTHVVVPLRRMLRGVQVEVGYVEEIDPVTRRVHVRRRQSTERFSVAYDALVVALGSVTDFRTVPGMADHALGVRTLGDAFYLRNRALSMLEEAASEKDPERCMALLRFVVVGGGSTGVEVAAELEDLVRTAADPGAARSCRAGRRIGHRDRHGRQHRRQRAAPGGPASGEHRRRRGCARLDHARRHVRRPWSRARVGARRLRVDQGSANGRDDAGDRAARDPGGAACRAERPCRARREGAAAVRLRPAGHARVARAVPGRGRGQGPQGDRVPRLVSLAELLT